MIEKVIKNIGKYFPEPCSIAQFGSSLNHSICHNDIDILIITDNNYYLNFESSLQKLVFDLKKGRSPLGFSPDDIDATLIKSNLEKDLYFDHIESTVIFSFGPSGVVTSFKYIFHIKGPLTVTQLELFGKLMPLHFNSIYDNHVCLTGNPFSTLGRQQIDFTTYLDFQNGLFLRFSETSGIDSRFKIYRKLIQNYETFLCIKCPEMYEQNDLMLDPDFMALLIKMLVDDLK